MEKHQQNIEKICKEFTQRVSSNSYWRAILVVNLDNILCYAQNLYYFLKTFSIMKRNV